MATLSQLPSDVDISFVSGDTFRIRVRVVDPSTGDPLVINPNPATAGEVGEYTFVAEISKTPGGAIVAQFEVTPDSEAPNQAVILSLSKSETAGLPSVGNGSLFTGVWDLEVTFP